MCHVLPHFLFRFRNILVSHQPVPPHFTIKLHPRTQLSRACGVLSKLNLLSPAPAKILAQVCNAVTRHPIELESYPNHPRIQQVFCLKSKKKDFRFGFGVRCRDRCKWGYFCFFWTPSPGPGPQPIGPLFWLKIFLETRPKSAFLEPLNDFLGYRERKLWLINQNLAKILLPQKPL